MRNPDVSMRDPLFWAWHKHIDQRVRLWESACGHADSMAGMSMGAASAPAAGERAVPAPALGVLALAALAAALSRRRA